MRSFVAALILFLTLLAVYADPASAQPVRVGYFANITHAQALVGKANGLFEKKLAAKIDWKIFNAGPTTMEALLSGALDIAYVGPNPAINAYIRSEGKSLRIIAGAASGGASLVVQKDAAVKGAADLKGKKVASPEYGNTQDVSLRHWLKANGLKPGRDIQVMPIKNAEILDLFLQKKIAAAWVPEPWVSRLLNEADGKILIDERSLWRDGKFPTAVVVVRYEFLEKNRNLVKNFLEAHVEATRLINESPVAAEKLLNSELAKITRKPLADRTLHEAMSRLVVTYDPGTTPLIISAGRAKELGFLPAAAKTSVAGVLDLNLLNQILKAKGLPPVK